VVGEEELVTRDLRAICPPTRNLHHNRRARDSSRRVRTTAVAVVAAAAEAVAAVLETATSALATLVVVNGALLHLIVMTATTVTTFLHLTVTTATIATVETAAIAIVTETSIGIRIGAAKRSLGGDTRRVRMRRPGRGRGGIPVVRVGAVVRTKCRVGSIRAMRMIIIPGEGGRLDESVSG